MSKRLEAARKGEVKFLGRPCKRSHDGWRYTATGACIECTKTAGVAYTERVRKLLTDAKK